MIIFRLNDLNFKIGRLKREGKDVGNLQEVITSILDKVYEYRYEVEDAMNGLIKPENINNLNYDDIESQIIKFDELLDEYKGEIKKQ